jgi:hypothetical protein
MGCRPARLRPMSMGNASSSPWLPFLLRRYFAQTEPASYRYHQISTEYPEGEPKSWYGYSKIMVLGSFLGILIIGGAVYFNQQLELCGFPDPNNERLDQYSSSQTTTELVRGRY